jgi:hypothetical protein
LQSFGRSETNTDYQKYSEGVSFMKLCNTNTTQLEIDWAKIKLKIKQEKEKEAARG